MGFQCSTTECDIVWCIPFNLYLSIAHLLRPLQLVSLFRPTHWLGFGTIFKKKKKIRKHFFISLGNSILYAMLYCFCSKDYSPIILVAFLFFFFVFFGGFFFGFVCFFCFVFFFFGVLFFLLTFLTMWGETKKIIAMA